VPLGRGKNIFFLPREAQLINAFFSSEKEKKGEKKVLPVRFSRSSFLVEKRFVETYQHRSSIEDLDVRNQRMKTIRDLDARFKR
jgi:hypothetical protein